MTYPVPRGNTADVPATLQVLHPDDSDGHKLLKARLPQVKWTTGEHEYSRYGFRKLIEDRSVDILQPDVMWLGGLTERAFPFSLSVALPARCGTLESITDQLDPRAALKVSAQAAAYDIPVVPHGSGPYSYHFILSQPHSPFCECTFWPSSPACLLPRALAHRPLSLARADIANSPDGKSIAPVFGNLLLDEPVPHGGFIEVGDAPGFGLELNPAGELVPSAHFLAPNPDKGLARTDDELRTAKLQQLQALKAGVATNGVNGH